MPDLLSSIEEDEVKIICWMIVVPEEFDETDESQPCCLK